MAWFWIVVALTLPAALAVLVAVPFWLKGVPIVGNTIGAAIIFTGAIASIGREYYDLQRLTRQCIDIGVACPIHPDPFTRFAVYGFVGMFQISALFVSSLWLEERIRRRSFSPEWQSR